MAIFKARFSRLSKIGYCAAIALTLFPAASLADPTSTRAPIVIGNDRGGDLRDRIRQISEIRESGQAVQVVGDVCYSTCTMFLGLPQTCVASDTIFGFHGPSSYGRPLPQDVFEQASQIIVDHYPAGLKTWFMEEARFELRRLYRIPGSEMIRIGVAAC